MRTAIVLLLSLAAISCAEDKKAPEQKRLESVTWDLNTHKLVWVVQHGTEQNGKFVSTGSDRYEISPDDAAMKFSNEKRGFTSEEAASLHKLLDTLSLYCAESVIWWDKGEGDKIEDSGGAKKEKVEHKTPPAPGGEPAGIPSLKAVLLAQGAQ
jgi:hypothetical protein